MSAKNKPYDTLMRVAQDEMEKLRGEDLPSPDAQPPSGYRRTVSAVQFGVRVPEQALALMDRYVAQKKLQGVLVRNQEVIEGLLTLLEDPEVVVKLEDKLEQLRYQRAVQASYRVRR